MTTGSELLWVLAVVCVAAGLAGTVLPALPGAPLVWLGLLFAAWADGFARVSGFTLALLALLALTTLAIDVFATAAGAKRVGADRWAMLGAALGTLAGIPFGLPGLVAGPFLGAALAEYALRRNWRRAGKVGVGTSFGLLLGIAAKAAVVFTMLGVFLLAYVL
jgi:uncharacterized protein YqgC (DUF456 family)